MGCVVTMTTRVPEASPGKAVEDIRGRPGYPAEPLAANHCDEVTLIHLAATETGTSASDLVTTRPRAPYSCRSPNISMRRPCRMTWSLSYVISFSLAVRSGRAQTGRQAGDWLSPEPGDSPDQDNARRDRSQSRRRGGTARIPCLPAS
jgi:hypothetical protein